MNSCAIAIDYEEPDPTTYEGVTLFVGEDRHRFATGDPTLDFATAVAVGRNIQEPKLAVYHASSVDHFQMDGGDLQTDSWTPEQIAEVKKRARAYLDSLKG